MKVRHESQPFEMCVRIQFGLVFRLYGDERGIVANPIQLKAIMDSHAPTSKKGV